MMITGGKFGTIPTAEAITNRFPQAKMFSVLVFVTYQRSLCAPSCRRVGRAEVGNHLRMPSNGDDDEVGAFYCLLIGRADHSSARSFGIRV